MNVTVDWLHICERLEWTPMRTPSIISIFERIGAESFPLTTHAMAIVIQFKGQNGLTFTPRVSITGDKGANVCTFKQPISLDKTGGFLLNLHVPKPTFPHAGKYEISVSCGDENLWTSWIFADQMEIGPRR